MSETKKVKKKSKKIRIEKTLDKLPFSIIINCLEFYSLDIRNTSDEYQRQRSETEKKSLERLHKRTIINMLYGKFLTDMTEKVSYIFRTIEIDNDFKLRLPDLTRSVLFTGAEHSPKLFVNKNNENKRNVLRCLYVINPTDSFIVNTLNNIFFTRLKVLEILRDEILPKLSLRLGNIREIEVGYCSKIEFVKMSGAKGYYTETLKQLTINLTKEIESVFLDCKNLEYIKASNRFYDTTIRDLYINVNPSNLIIQQQKKLKQLLCPNTLLGYPTRSVGEYMFDRLNHIFVYFVDHEDESNVDRYIKCPNVQEIGIATYKNATAKDISSIKSILTFADADKLTHLGCSNVFFPTRCVFKNLKYIEIVHSEKHLIEKIQFPLIETIKFKYLPQLVRKLKENDVNLLKQEYWGEHIKFPELKSITVSGLEKVSDDKLQIIFRNWHRQFIPQLLPALISKIENYVNIQEIVSLFKNLLGAEQIRQCDEKLQPYILKLNELPNYAFETLDYRNYVELYFGTKTSDIIDKKNLPYKGKLVIREFINNKYREISDPPYWMIHKRVDKWRLLSYFMEYYKLQKNFTLIPLGDDVLNVVSKIIEYYPFINDYFDNVPNISFDTFFGDPLELDDDFIKGIFIGIDRLKKEMMAIYRSSYAIYERWFECIIQIIKIYSQQNTKLIYRIYKWLFENQNFVWLIGDKSHRSYFTSIFGEKILNITIKMLKFFINHPMTYQDYVRDCAPFI